jgi:peptidoglycan/LPS O-acetylase OafA/YrhL
LKYRAEIDGLRALAVIPVVLFHAGFELFSGGFVGVDVFFVISGYLITTLLIEDIEHNRFSITNFYERRARRILPALFFVMLMCIPFAWMWMVPSQMKDFSQSLVAVSVFVSNFHFLRESGYFEAAAEEKPLLHTWSLAIEEQYYLLFPIFLFFTWRYGKNRVFWTIVVLTTISFTLSEWGWRNKATAAANFYLAPTRAWELFAGSIAAFVAQKRGIQANNTLSFLGLIAITFAIFSYDESTPFPSVYTLVPVIGVVLLILYADRETFAARLLSTRVLVGVGLISYSTYLWHQPLFAFARVFSSDTPNPSLMLMLSFASLVLAIVSWRYVERPFRDRSRFSKTKIFFYSSIGFSFFIFLGVIGIINEGFRQQNDTISTPPLTENIWVIGDSHAGHLVSGLKKITNGEVRKLTSPGCIPFRDVDRYDSRFKKGACPKKMGAYLDELIRIDPNAIVILSSMGPVYLDGTTFKGKAPERIAGLGVELISKPQITDRWAVYELGMKKTFNELSQLKKAKIVFAIDVPELGIDLGCGSDSKILKTPWFELSDFTDQIYSENVKNCFVQRSLYNERTNRYKRLVHSITAKYPSISLFDPTDYFCGEFKCYGHRKKIGFIYRDIDHLSERGSYYWASYFSNWILKHK